jgi:purine-binding chemotaxis protein CheW
MGRGEEQPRVEVLVVRAGELRCALTLDVVTEVLPLVATTPLPNAPAVLEGVIDLHGALVPVLGLRARLGLPRRAPDLEDHIVVCTVAGRPVGIWVDRAEDVVAVDPRDVAPVDEVAAADFLAGVTRLDDGLVLVYDVRTFLDADELLALDDALEGATAGRR